jgi:hypothetical protein
MIEGLKVIKKVDDTIKKATSSSADNKKGKGDKSAKKGRPTCKRDEDDERRLQRQALLTNPNLKFIGMQIEKLENMHVILTAEDGMSEYLVLFGVKQCV